MKWTFTKPNRPGWWWYRIGRCPVYVRSSGSLGLIASTLPGQPTVAECHGEWSDEPIAEPTSDREGP